MKGNWFAEREEPDRGFALFAVLAVEGVKDFRHDLRGTQQLGEVLHTILGPDESVDSQLVRVMPARPSSRGTHWVFSFVTVRLRAAGFCGDRDRVLLTCTSALPKDSALSSPARRTI